MEDTTSTSLRYTRPAIELLRPELIRFLESSSRHVDLPQFIPAPVALNAGCSSVLTPRGRNSSFCSAQCSLSPIFPPSQNRGYQVTYTIERRTWTPLSRPGIGEGYRAERPQISPIGDTIQAGAEQPILWCLPTTGKLVLIVGQQPLYGCGVSAGFKGDTVHISSF